MHLVAVTRQLPGLASARPLCAVWRLRGTHSLRGCAHCPRPRGPADLNDWGTSHETPYMQLHFCAPGQAVVLLPQNMREPRWLRDGFYKLREPLYQNPVAVRFRCARTPNLVSAERRTPSHC
jgi:hypothetical protein